MTEPRSLYLERRDPARNMARFYALEIVTDLFGVVVAFRRWGRIGSRGRALATTCGSLREATALVEARALSKRRRGYCERDEDAAETSALAGRESS